MTSLFEELGGTYTRQGNYLLPDLSPPIQNTGQIGLWARRHMRYLRQIKPVVYCNLLTSGIFPEYLADIEQQAQDMYDRLLPLYAKAAGITEELKAADSLAWCQQMNAIRHQVTEVVNAELIFT